MCFVGNSPYTSSPSALPYIYTAPNPSLSAQHEPTHADSAVRRSKQASVPGLPLSAVFGSQSDDEQVLHFQIISDIVTLSTTGACALKNQPVRHQQIALKQQLLAWAGRGHAHLLAKLSLRCRS